MKHLQRPIFLVGTVRGGTTVTARLLGDHPLIRYVGFELAAEWSRVGRAPLAHAETDDPECPALGAEHGTAEVREALHACFVERFAEAGVRQFFLNKNPHLSNKLGYVRALFPDASLVVSSRDLRSTVASIHRRSLDGRRFRISLPEHHGACWSQSPPHDLVGADPTRTFPGGDIRVIAEYWLRTYEAIDAEFTKFERAALVHHRVLMASPRAELARVTHELEIPARDFELSQTLDETRNQRWSEILSGVEQDLLDEFIVAHRDRIAALRSADASV